MNITELFPDATRIDFEEIQPGDTIARLRGGVIVAGEVVKQTEFNGPDKWLSPDAEVFAAIKGHTHYLIYRPTPSLPTIFGSMIRITDTGRNASTYAGNVYKWESGRRLFRDYENSHKLTIEDIRNGEIEWEQVFYTTTDPEGIVDAEVLEGDDDGVPNNLIELTSGMYRGALLRYHELSNHFRGIDPEGNPLSLTHATVDGSDWIAAALTRGI